MFLNVKHGVEAKNYEDVSDCWGDRLLFVTYQLFELQTQSLPRLILLDIQYL